MVGDPLFDYGEVTREASDVPSKSCIPDNVQFEDHPQALKGQLKCLPEDQMYTDEEACAMDAFNMGVAKVLLTRETVGVPTGTVMFMHETGDDAGKTVCQPAIEKAGYRLKRVGNKKTPAKFACILQQKRGVYIVEYFWKNKESGEKNWHVVAVNCCQRRVFCNTLGVLPFSMMKARESKATHAALVKALCVINVTRVWRVLRKA